MTKQYCELGNIIRNQLILLDKNQAWLADQCTVSNGQISHILLGRSKPSIKVVRLLSAALMLDCEKIMKAV